MCPAPVRPKRAAVPAAPAAEAKRAPAAPVTTASAAVDGFQPVKSAPYAPLAAMGNFDSYVRTVSGVDVYVRIRQGRNAASTPPLVFLDGLNGAAARSKGLDELVEKDGVTLVSIALIGQGETLVKDVEATGGRSVDQDVDPQAQVRLVLETLDQLGVKGPVDLAGLSYGGGIAALVKQQAPERVNRLLLAAPYTVTAMEHDPVRFAMGELLNHNPFNPFGPAIYRATVRATLAAGTLPPAPIRSPRQALAFQEAIFRMTMGMEQFKLKDAVKGLDDVHVLTVPFDPIVPPAIAHEQTRSASSVSYSEASLWDTATHDLIDWRPKTLVDWMRKVLAGEIAAKRR